jgi:hypothetical protein
VRATEAAGVAEIHELEAAHFALAIEQGRLVDVLARGARPGLDAGRFLLRLGQVMVGAGLAEVQLFNLVFAEDLGDVQGGGVMTLLAFHGRGILVIALPAEGHQRHFNRGG